MLGEVDPIAMTSYSMQRFVVNISFRSARRRPNVNQQPTRLDTRGPTHGRWQRQFSSGDHEQVPFHATTPHLPENLKYEQKRSISTAELDKYRDTRERIVILGSGWAGYTLSKEIDHRKYQVVIVSSSVYREGPWHDLT